MAKVTVEIARGKGGRFRAKIYMDGRYWGMSSIRGYETFHGAHDAAVAAFGQDVTIEGSLDEQLYAGPRDFDNI